MSIEKRIFACYQVETGRVHVNIINRKSTAVYKRVGYYINIE